MKNKQVVIAVIGSIILLFVSIHHNNNKLIHIACVMGILWIIRELDLSFKNFILNDIYKTIIGLGMIVSAIFWLITLSNIV